MGSSGVAFRLGASRSSQTAGLGHRRSKRSAVTRTVNLHVCHSLGVACICHTIVRMIQLSGIAVLDEREEVREPGTAGKRGSTPRRTCWTSSPHSPRTRCAASETGCRAPGSAPAPTASRRNAAPPHPPHPPPAACQHVQVDTLTVKLDSLRGTGSDRARVSLDHS